MQLEHFQYFMNSLGFILSPYIDSVSIGNLTIDFYIKDNSNISHLFTSQGYSQVHTGIVHKDGLIIEGFINPHTHLSSTNGQLIEKLIKYNDTKEADEEVLEFLDKHNALGARIVNISDFKPQ